MSDSTTQEAPKQTAKKSPSKPKAKRETAAQAEARKQKTADDKQAKLEKSQTVTHTVQTMNGRPLHLCQDGEWRTDEDLQTLGQED